MKSQTTSSLQRNTRRAVLVLAAAPLLAGVTTSVFAQQAWPNKTVKLVVPFPPGGPTDTITRIVGQRLSEQVKQTVMVDNRAGASGSIAAGQVAKTEPDGYTLMMLATPTLLAPHLYKSVKYNTAKDFTPVAMVYDLPLVIVVNPELLPNVTDLQKLIAHAKAEKGKVNYTSAGVGSFGHLSTELLKQMGGFDMMHIPYKGSTPAITDVIGGRVPIMFADLIAAQPHIQSGKLRAIAVGSFKRVSTLADVKTIDEQGFQGYEAVSWGGIVAPPGMPKALVDSVANEIKKILDDKQVQDRIAETGAFAHFVAPAPFGEIIEKDYAKWGKVIRDNNITTN